MAVIRAALMAALLLVACGGDDTGETADYPTPACSQAFEGIDADNPDDDLTPAFDACENRDDFIAAAAEHPDAINGDPDDLIDNFCSLVDSNDLAELDGRVCDD